MASRRRSQPEIDPVTVLTLTTPEQDTPRIQNVISKAMSPRTRMVKTAPAPVYSPEVIETARLIRKRLGIGDDASMCLNAALGDLQQDALKRAEAQYDSAFRRLYLRLPMPLKNPFLTLFDKLSFFMMMSYGHHQLRLIARMLGSVPIDDTDDEVGA